MVERTKGSQEAEKNALQNFQEIWLTPWKKDDQ